MDGVIFCCGKLFPVQFYQELHCVVVCECFDLGSQRPGLGPLALRYLKIRMTIFVRFLSGRGKLSRYSLCPRLCSCTIFMTIFLKYTVIFYLIVLTRNFKSQLLFRSFAFRCGML